MATRQDYGADRAADQNSGRRSTGGRPFVTVGAVVLVLLPGCLSSDSASQDEVVVYAALDAEFSEPILDSFAEERGITVLPRFDVESTKTVGLVTRLIEERRRPRCDVFWNNEILHTLRLEREGLLDVYLSEVGQDYPPAFRSPDGTWYGFAARARVLIVNTDLLEADAMPDSIHDLVDPRWEGRVGIAKPLFGTTATHAAVLFSLWGSERARDYYAAVRQNARVLSGNKQVALAVGRGELAFGITDTDDAIIEVEEGRPVAIVFPDQQPDGLGALFIPNTLSIMKDCPHPEAARVLVDYLLQPETEARLARGPSAQIPLHPDGNEASRVEPETEIRWMEVDFRAAAAAWDEASTFLRDAFGTAD